MTRSPRGPVGIAIAFGLVATWLVAAYFAFPVLRDHAPDFVRHSMSLSTFRTLVQALVLAVFAGAFFGVVPDARRVLGLERLRCGPLGRAALTAPFAFVSATMLAIAIATPILLRELAERGAGVSRANAGSFGRELQESPALVIVVAGAILAPLGEELLFRGGLYGTLKELLLRVTARPVDPDVPAELQPRVSPWLVEGLPLVMAAATFSAMHADMPGGVGVVRIVSTAVLSVFTGLARALGGGVLASAVLHAAYNGLALLVARGVFKGSGSWSGAPVPLVVAGVVGLGIAVAWGLAASRRATPGSSSG